MKRIIFMALLSLVIMTACKGGRRVEDINQFPSSSTEAVPDKRDIKTSDTGAVAAIDTMSKTNK